MSDDSRMRDALTQTVVDMTQAFRVTFHVAMMSTKTPGDRAYVMGAAAHFAACVLATTWPPRMDREDFKNLVMQTFPGLIDGGLDSIEKMRVMDAEALSKVLRDTGKLQ